MSRIKIGNIKGPKGDKGEQGAVGPKGEQGIQGPVGPAGGVNSVNGMTGDVTIKAKQITKSIATSEWSGEGPYTCEIKVESLTTKQLTYVTADFSGKTPQEVPTLIDAFADACITAPQSLQGDGKIVLQAANKPAAELPIIIIIGGELTNG